MSRRIGAAASMRVLLWLLILNTAACTTSVRFQAETVVNADGSLARIARMALGGDLPQDYLEQHYELTPGGSWGVAAPPPQAAVTAPGANLPFAGASARLRYGAEYSVSRSIARGNPIPGDYRRKARLSEQVAANTIRVRHRRFWFLDTYSYEERFSDIVTLETLSTGFRTLVDLLIDELSTVAATLPDVVLSAEEIDAHLTSLLDGTLEQILDLAAAHCVGESIAAFDCLEEVYEQNDEIRALVALFDGPGVSGDADAPLLDAMAEILLPPGDSDVLDRRERIRVEVVRVAFDRLEREIDGEAGVAIAESIAGVGGWALFETYPFELSLRLPGTVVRDNADSFEVGLLRWAFAGDDFVLNDRVLRASSRVVHGDRLLFAGLLAVVLILLAARRALYGRKDEFRGPPV